MNTKINAFYERSSNLFDTFHELNRLTRWWRVPEESRNVRRVSRHLLFYGLLLGAHFMMGCSSVIVPLVPGDAASMDSGQGLIFGHTHVTVNENAQPSTVVLPSDMQWLLSNNRDGKPITIDALPIDGPFVFKLPAGTYRLSTINLDVTLGVWHAVASATFTVRSGACTYVGSWELDIHEDFFSGSITRRVSNQLARDVGYLRKILGGKSCPILKAPLPPALDAESELIDRVEGTELTSPP